MKKIETLTPTQVAQLSVYRDLWLKHGLCTEPADRFNAEKHVREAYEAAGLVAPKIIIWLNSPVAGAIGAYLLTNLPKEITGAQVRDQVGDQVGDQVRDQVGDQVRDQVGDQVGDQVRDQVGAQVRDQVRDQVGAQVRAQVRDQVWDQVGAQVRDQVWAQVWDQVGDQVGDQVYRAGYGSHDANWLGFYQYFAEVCGLQSKVNKLTGLVGLGQTCGWWWPFANVVILTERPKRIARDEQNRLHCETGKAIEYPDGWGVYSWHGTRVPEDWIEQKNKLNPVDILAHANIEQRRAGCEIIGWDKMLKLLDAKVVDQDVDPEIGTLLRVDLPDAPGSMFLRVQCGTGRKFAIPVPAEMTTALAANAWTYDLKPLEYKLEVRT